ncbi:MAG TPA: hypothetical protein PK104_11735, partial [Spirochaetota bacterium]|nr:hypothetical protein [Spirochaetota bacterium]
PNSIFTELILPPLAILSAYALHADGKDYIFPFLNLLQKLVLYERLLGNYFPKTFHHRFNSFLTCQSLSSFCTTI